MTENQLLKQEFEDFKSSSSVMSVTRLNEELKETIETLKHDNAKLKEDVIEINKHKDQDSKSERNTTPAPPSSRSSRKTCARTTQVKDGTPSAKIGSLEVKDGFTQERDLYSSNNSMITPRRSMRNKVQD